VGRGGVLRTPGTIGSVRQAWKRFGFGRTLALGSDRLRFNGLLRSRGAALYTRVSTEKQEREETVASQVDLLYKAAAASGYDIAPTSVFIDEGVSGARLERPALDRVRDLAAEGPLRCYS
jgi:hypothetical protein